MNEKKIEPTEAMVDIVDLADKLMVVDTRDLLRYALNHPDARGLFADEDALRAAREQGWDQATRWIDSYQGGPNGRTTSARSANPYRPVQELPTGLGAVIVAKEGGGGIEATVLGIVWRAREAVFGGDGRWHGVWRSTSGAISYAAPDQITPGTWKVEEK